MRKATLSVPVWAREIQFRRIDDDKVIIAGRGVYRWLPAERLRLEQDLLQQADSRKWREPHAGNRPPHIRFANANTRVAQLRFLRDFGPVSAKMEVQELATPGSDENKQGMVYTASVEQSLSSLRRDRDLFVRAMTILAQVRSEPLPEAAILFRSVERLARALRVRLPLHWDCRIPELSARTLAAFQQLYVSAANDLLCHLLDDKCPVRLTVLAGNPIEAPVYAPDGILPSLYYLLRQDFLSGERRIAICENCRDFFSVERRGARFCSPRCSKLKRGLDYWHGVRKRAKK